MSCLDFAGATLDTPMEFSEDVWADWRATRQEQFGQDWPTVTLILNELAHYGIHLLDVSPSNIRVR